MPQIDELEPEKNYKQLTKSAEMRAVNREYDAISTRLLKRFEFVEQNAKEECDRIYEFELYRLRKKLKRMNYPIRVSYRVVRHRSRNYWIMP